MENSKEGSEDDGASNGSKVGDYFPGSHAIDVETPTDNDSESDSEHGTTDEDDDNDNDNDGNGQEGTTTTKSGRKSKPPTNFEDDFDKLCNKKDDEMGNIAPDIRANERIPELSSAEQNFYDKMCELGIAAYDADGHKDSEHNLVGAGIGGGFVNASELIPMKHNEAMKTKDKKGWEKSVDEEHDRFLCSSFTSSIEVNNNQ